MQTNPILAADLAVTHAELPALRFHAERLRDAKLITDACQLAEHLLNAIDGLPALYAAPVEGAL